MQCWMPDDGYFAHSQPDRNGNSALYQLVCPNLHIQAISVQGQATPICPASTIYPAVPAVSYAMRNCQGDNARCRETYNMLHEC